nr:uncharacterized protein LOC109162705 [Ipomoea batatas]
MFEGAKVCSFVCPYSDHLRLMITPEGITNAPRRRRFCFDNMWLKETTCREIVEHSLDKTVGFDVLTRIAVCIHYKYRFNTSKPTAINETENQGRARKNTGNLLLNQEEQHSRTTRNQSRYRQNLSSPLSNCYNEEQREVYRVEKPPERGIIDAAREWVSTRSRRISVVDEISHRRGRRKPLLNRQYHCFVSSRLPSIARTTVPISQIGEERMIIRSVQPPVGVVASLFSPETAQYFVDPKP